ncbi:MAG TPA: M24 family metallopeptidase [Candidatus Fimivivens sp.]|nr:M24 family metallopeptidase [Candidatus Fimivivens sp.]
MKPAVEKRLRNTWTPEQIEKHKKAVKLLHAIVLEAFEYIARNGDVTEYEVREFILGRYEYHGLVSDRPPIVAFRENTAIIHHFPEKRSKKIKPESPVLIDVWARLKTSNSPFADITWMGYYGKKIPKRFEEIFGIVVRSRDACVRLIRKNLKAGTIVTGIEAHAEADRVLVSAGFESKHGTGHSIGFRSPHGSFEPLNRKGKVPLKTNLGYTIEPGIYVSGELGARSEIDFYIDNGMVMRITGKVQKEIVRIGA